MEDRLDLFPAGSRKTSHYHGQEKKQEWTELEHHRTEIINRNSKAGNSTLVFAKYYDFISHSEHLCRTRHRKRSVQAKRPHFMVDHASRSLIRFANGEEHVDQMSRGTGFVHISSFPGRSGMLRLRRKKRN